MELEIKNLEKSFGKIKVVDNITYQMNKGVYGLLGINGVGKTTLIRMLTTLITPTSGSIKYNGEDIETLKSEYRKILGYLPQDFGFYPDLSIYDYMMYISSIKGIQPRVAKNRILELLDKVSLLKEKNKKMGRLSGGMQRRVGIAQAMLNNPKILILDEPTAGLDPNERIKFRNLISDLSEERLVLLSTHIVSDIEFIAKEILIMKNGKFELTGTYNEIISKMNKDIWTLTIKKDKADEFFDNHFVINKKMLADEIEVRVISDKKPSELAIRQTPTLEDAFLAYFGGDLND